MLISYLCQLSSRGQISFGLISFSRWKLNSNSSGTQFHSRLLTFCCLTQHRIFLVMLDFWKDFFCSVNVIRSSSLLSWMRTVSCFKFCLQERFLNFLSFLFPHLNLKRCTFIMSAWVCLLPPESYLIPNPHTPNLLLCRESASCSLCNCRGGAPCSLGKRQKVTHTLSI